MLKSFQVVSKTFQQLSTEELYKLLSLRIEVFCVEQNCPYQDIDGVDKSAQHFFIEAEMDIITYARVIAPNNNICHIGRVVVAKKYRHQSLATKIMQESIEFCKKHYPNVIIEISAQTYLSKFYQSLGFKSMGKYYLEDDIPHELMQIQAI